MYELQQTEFNKINHLLDTEFHLPEIKAVVDGLQPGWVFVDNTEQPQTAIVYVGEENGFMFLGEIDNDLLEQLNPFIENELQPKLEKIGVNFFEGSGTNHTWNKRLKNELSKRWDIGEWEILLFEFDKPQFNFNELEGQTHLRTVNDGLLEDKTIKNMEFIKEKILTYWDSLEAFYEKGIGCAVIDENEIASLCFSCYVAGDVYKVDIETLEHHRKKGYARLAAQGYIKECIQQGKTPYWDCMKKNVPSHILAVSLGFKLEDETVTYDFYF